MTTSIKQFVFKAYFSMRFDIETKLFVLFLDCCDRKQDENYFDQGHIETKTKLTEFSNHSNTRTVFDTKQGKR
jgi:hypothetical protein